MNCLFSDDVPVWCYTNRFLCCVTLLFLLQQQSRAESSASKSSALGVIPFELSAEVIEQLECFKNGSCSWVEMTVVNEVINLLGFRTVKADDNFQSYIDNETARYSVYMYICICICINVLCN